MACLNSFQETEKKHTDIALGINCNIKCQKKLNIDIEANKLKEVFEVGEILNRNSLSDVEPNEIDKILKFLQKLPPLKGKFDLLTQTHIRVFMSKMRIRIAHRGSVL